MTDLEFLSAFETATLPRTEWTHTAHVRMAFLYLRETVDFAAALDRIRKGIQHYNANYSNRSGYHETITVAFACLIRERLQSAPQSAVTFDAFCAAHPDLLDASALLAFYTRSFLMSRTARDQFVGPDLAPLPNQFTLTRTPPRER